MGGTNCRGGKTEERPSKALWDAERAKILKLKEEELKKKEEEQKIRDVSTTTPTNTQTARNHRVTRVRRVRIPPNNRNATCTACGYYGHDGDHCFIVHRDMMARYLINRPEDRAKFAARIAAYEEKLAQDVCNATSSN